MRILEGNAATFNHRATQALIELQSAQFELNLLRGVAVNLPVEVARQSVNLPTLPDSDRLIASAYEQNFDLQTRRAELEQQGFRMRLARNEHWPSVKMGPYTAGEPCGRQRTRAWTQLVGVPAILEPGPRIRRGREGPLNQADVSLAAAMRDLERQIMTAAHSYDPGT